VVASSAAVSSSEASKGGSAGSLFPGLLSPIPLWIGSTGGPVQHRGNSAAGQVTSLNIELARAPSRLHPVTAMGRRSPTTTVTCTYVEKVQHKCPGHLACKALMERTRATLDKGRHPAKTMSPVGHPPGCRPTTSPDSPWKGPSESGGPHHRGREPVKAEHRSGPTQFANQLLTKMHGRIRIDGDGYGRELTNAQ